ncbi:DUF2798 domain-containing protein [Carnobacterium maltaromaticum]|uniref:DUF2798 domain-containing protein n=1 Tax=Carnobacterium maltaromaticum TaxID=2751 RepID=UPI000C76847E|nr:DUF2798 domain-containing protein [Carnobacterium maltaromaticum]PLS35108.1 DUF2798 domain-containing protein [Carnobacterium maltaromaticum]PLS35522.1 DUF2798 domain-containing protein [Carnobacterium maltaromaticum]PLS35972.1 DUF2798 domain-containing protein [Carnobacterium maltaromaticum]PLS42430.1 DUF2798 domain-containing protein [Carnobacterium maltaromaticum]PLS45450.1 DUF2798 domain-containing protein [Carnobacterium maltaromaticum]
MPTNKKEGIFFTVVMCSLMVLGMTIYNIALVEGISLGLVKSVAFDFSPGFIVALLIDVVIVSPVAKKLAFKLPINKEKPWQIILAISGCMVCGMVLFMSIFCLVTEGNFSGNIFMNYLVVVRNNILMALPLQWLIVGPLARKILNMYQNRQFETA